jgi:hypothetical protein
LSKIKHETLKGYSTQVPVKARYLEQLVMNGPDKILVIGLISKEGKKGAFSDDIDWRCTSGDQATKSAGVAPFAKYPPCIIELTFFPICDKVPCEYGN